MESIEEILGNLGIALPEVPKTNMGLYAPVNQVGDICYVSGQVPIQDREIITGVAETTPLKDAKEAARICVLYALAHLQKYLGSSLDNVVQIVRVEGYVNAGDGFADHSKVIDGASEFLLDVFGPEAGSHARIAVGTSSLPGGALVEVALQVQVETTE